MARITFLSVTNALESFVTPPCKGAAVAVWLAFVAFFIADRNDALRYGDLYNPDDYLYLVQAIDWLNGQSWFDLIQHRMDPPQGTLIHYSHMLSAFYAGFIVTLRPFFGTLSAAIITAALAPLIYLAAFLFALRRVAQIMIDPEWGDLTALMLMVSPVILSQFWMGAIHHHGIEALLAITALGCMTQMVERPRELKWAVAAGIALAFGLALGLEILAILALFSLCLGIWAAVEGVLASRSGAVFGATLFLGSLCFLLATHSPEHLFDILIPAYSIVYVIFAGCIASCFACVALMSNKTSALWRCVIGGGMACCTGLLFLHWFPALKAGPYGGVDPSLTRLIFFSEPEAWPGVRADIPWYRQALPLIWPIIAIASNIFILAHTKDRAKRWLWGMILMSLSVCTALAEFYQCRLFDYAQPLATLPLVAMVRRDWLLTPKNYQQHFWRILRLLLILVVGPATFLAASSHFNGDAPGQSHSATSAQKPAEGCDMHALADVLNDKQGLGNHPRLIINSLNEGPELLFRTSHSVLAGPYHMNQQGNMDALDFFTTSNPDEAKAIAEKRRASLVVICTTPVQLRAYEIAPTFSAQTSFIQQLMNGKIPPWLRQIQSQDFHDLRLFEIQEQPQT